MKNKKLWIALAAVLVGLVGVGGLLAVQWGQEPHQPVVIGTEDPPALLQEERSDGDADTTTASTEQTDATIPQDTQPGDIVPEWTEPDRSRPEATEPNPTEPEATKPVPSVPKETTSNNQEPDVTEPATTKPVPAAPEADQPKATEPTHKDSTPTEPNITEPEKPEPDVTEPEATEPEMIQPEVTIPEETQPTVSEPEATEPEITEPQPTEPPKPERQEPKAGNFTVYDASGNAVTLSDYLGKPIVLNFWASWCGPCKWEMPGFQLLYEELGDQVQFLMVNLTGYDDPASAQALIAQSGYTFPILFDTTLDAADTYSVTAFPTTVFIDAEGYLMETYVGAMDESTLRNKIDWIR